jgi:hypothetical protein
MSEQLSMETPLEHEKLHINMDVSDAFEWLEWFLVEHRLSWPEGECNREFALIVVNSLRNAITQAQPAASADASEGGGE